MWTPRPGTPPCASVGSHSLTHPAIHSARVIAEATARHITDCTLIGRKALQETAPSRALGSAPSLGMNARRTSFHAAGKHPLWIHLSTSSA